MIDTRRFWRGVFKLSGDGGHDQDFFRRSNIDTGELNCATGAAAPSAINRAAARC